MKQRIRPLATLLSLLFFASIGSANPAAQPGVPSIVPPAANVPSYLLPVPTSSRLPVPVTSPLATLSPTPAASSRPPKRTPAHASPGPKPAANVTAPPQAGACGGAGAGGVAGSTLGWPPNGAQNLKLTSTQPVPRPVASLYSPVDASITLTWSVDKQQVATSRVTVPACATRTASFDGALPNGGSHTVGVTFVVNRSSLPTGVSIRTISALASRSGSALTIAYDYSSPPILPPVATGGSGVGSGSGGSTGLAIGAALAAVVAIGLSAHRISGSHHAPDGTPLVSVAFEGSIEGERHQPLPDATVELRQGLLRERAARRVVAQSNGGTRVPQRSTHVDQVESDANGKYRIIRLLSPGLYYIVASHFGTELATAQFAIAASDGQYVINNFVLKPLKLDARKVWFARRTIYYATDRLRTMQGKYPSYGPDPAADDARISLGTCYVDVAKDPEHAVAPDSSTYQFVQQRDISGHAVLDETLFSERYAKEKRSSFFESVNKAALKSKSRTVLLFIHGFNNTFNSAAMASAQLQYDLNFDGPTIFYSWASAGDIIKGYLHDRDRADETAPRLADFVISLARYFDPTIRIDVVAHSMGNRALIEALQKLPRVAPGSTPYFSQVILTAPDYEADQFREPQVADEVKSTSEHLTLYASSTDQALIVSQTIHGTPRLGLITNGMPVIVPGIDSIDASGVDTGFLGHSYFSDSKSVVTDMYDVFHFVPLPRRTNLEPVKVKKGEYWKFAAVSGR